MPSKPSNYLIDTAAKSMWQRAVNRINAFQRQAKPQEQQSSQETRELFSAPHVNDAQISIANPMHDILPPAGLSRPTEEEKAGKHKEEEHEDQTEQSVRLPTSNSDGGGDGKVEGKKIAVL